MEHGAMKNPYAARLRELREGARKNFTELARELKVTRQAVANWENPDANAPSTKNLAALASFYELDVSDLTRAATDSKVDMPALYSRLPPDARVREDSPLPTNPIASDVPLMGVAVGGVSGDFAFNGEVISYVPRPHGLKHARGIFAVHILSESMAPRFEPGEMVYASSMMAPVPGDDIIIELHPEPGGAEMPAYIKRLVRRTADTLVCRQFNPDQEVAFKLADIARIHRVMRVKELFGS